MQELSAKISRSIEQHAAAAASSGKLTIMKNAALEGSVLPTLTICIVADMTPLRMIDYLKKRKRKRRARGLHRLRCRSAICLSFRL
jgi:hypothetical protein